MIPGDWEYHRPETAAEAVATWHRLHGEGRSPVYYGGGTEILTMARLGELDPGAVIDIKAVPECGALERRGAELVFGAARTLEDVAASRLWPLLSDASGRVADHTSRRQITLGGNLAGTLPYREAALPFLLAPEARALVAGRSGLRWEPFAAVFDGTLRLPPGEFLVQLAAPAGEAALPHYCVKQTRLDWIDYPLLTVAALRRDGRLHAAYSGLCALPFRCEGMDEALDAGDALEAVRRIPTEVADDLHGSAEYRRFVLRDTLNDVLRRLGEAVA